MKTKALIDVDALIYAIGFVGEKRTIQVVDPKSGWEAEYANRTEFWGRGKKIGGVLATINAERKAKGEEEYTKDSFDIFDIQRLKDDPIQNVLHSAKTSYLAMANLAKCDTHMGYVGGKENFRIERSTILKYKGNRDDALSPILKPEIIEYYMKYHGVQRVEKPWETDDQLVMEGYKRKDVILVVVDKDYMGTSCQIIDSNRPEVGLINGDCFGKLYLDESGKVRGWGRLFFYWQVANGDDSDHYYANSASDIKWADMGAYSALKDCKTDKEAFVALKSVYQMLYPESKEIVGWRGNTINIDWKYVLNENWDLARLLRWEGDEVKATDVLDKFGVLDD